METEVLPVTEQYGLGVLVWSPLASGWLTGAVREGREITTNRSTFMPQRFDITIPSNRARLDAVERLAEVADEAGLTMIQLALGFVTAHPAVTSAIIGPRTLDHLDSQLAAADTVLSADVLDAIVAPGVDSPHTRNSTLRPPCWMRHCDAADGARAKAPMRAVALRAARRGTRPVTRLAHTSTDGTEGSTAPCHTPPNRVSGL